MGEQATSGTDSGKLYRRLILGACVVAALVNLLLSGCASVDVQCGMRTAYSATTPIAPTGRVEIAWAFNQGMPAGRYGEAIPGDVTILRLAGPPPSFDDVCGLARLGHEVSHAMHARHE